MTPAPDAAPDSRTWELALLALCVLVYLGYSSFGIAHPCLWGHMGHHEAEYMMRVRTTFRFHLVTPATHAGFDPPAPRDYYFHHPIGYHHLLALWTLLVGDHPWTPTTLPVLTGLFTLWALYRLVARFWSRRWALVAVAAWVALPIVWSFSILTDAMFPAMACSIVTAQAWVRYAGGAGVPPAGPPLQRRALVEALIAQLVGAMLFWEAYIQLLVHGVMALAWARKRPERRRARTVWIASTTLLATATMSFHLAFMSKMGMWGDFWSSFSKRHNASFTFVIARIAEWLFRLYGLPLVAVGVAWLFLWVRRLRRGEGRPRDQAVFTFFAINVLYICAFAEGAALHLYRVFWFSTFLVLAVVDVAGELCARLEARGSAHPRGATALALALGGLAVLPQSVHNLLQSRLMMGTHGLAGYDPDVSKLRFGEEVQRRTRPADFVLIDDNVPHRVELLYLLDRSNAPLHGLAKLAEERKQHPRPVILVDTNASAGERKLLYRELGAHPALVFDHFAMIDDGEALQGSLGLREFAWRRLPMSARWRWLVSHVYPPLEPQPETTQLTACVAAATGVAPPRDAPEVAPPPPLAPSETLGCWLNYAAVRGRPADGERLFATLAGARADGQLSWGRALLFRNVNRRGLELWGRVENPRAPGARYVLQPVAGGPLRAVAVQGAIEQSLDETRAGEWFAQRLTYAAPPGEYRLLFDDGTPRAPLRYVGTITLH